MNELLWGKIALETLEEVGIVPLREFGFDELGRFGIDRCIGWN